MTEPQGQKPPFRRRKILVDKKFQLQYLYIWFFTAVGMILVTGVFYFISRRFVDTETSGVVLRLMAGTGAFILLFTLLMGTISVVLTHRVAGAVFRIDGFIKKLIRNDHSDFIKLRKTDYLHNIADSLNELNHMLAVQKEKLQDLSARSREIQADTDPAKLRQSLDDIRRIADELNGPA
ncbi:MAG: hypothetical protein A2Z34_06070 [Planctomycetes bacterium RBG_16_59_8]|nr:MAG: hypothetical protein A2Z34_06070 [Planctomycetes bacterium RBG_16_59_8]